MSQPNSASSLQSENLDETSSEWYTSTLFIALVSAIGGALLLAGFLGILLGAIAYNKRRKQEAEPFVEMYSTNWILGAQDDMFDNPHEQTV